MNPIATQQATLDNALVPPEKRLKNERCNARTAFGKPQRGETYQVTLEALKLAPCYLAFVITAEVLEICMHQFCTTIKKKFRVDTELWEDFMYQADNNQFSKERAHALSRFTIINHFISKYKTITMRNRIKLYRLCDDSLLGTLKFVSKTQDYQQYGALIPDDMINKDIKDSEAYKTYYNFATKKVPSRKAQKYKKVDLLSRKLSPVKEAKPVKKGKRVKRPAKKSTTAPTASVVIRDTPGVSVSKKKAPAKADRSKAIEKLFDVALSKAAQLKEATKKSKKDFHISQASGLGDGTNFESWVPDEQQRKIFGTDEGTGTKPGIPDVPTYDSESENEPWGDSEDDNDDDSDDDSKGDDDKADSNDDGNSDADDNEKTDSDVGDENPSFTLKDYDEEEHDKEKCDEEMTDADQNVPQENSYEQVVKDAHVTLTSSQKTDSTKQSSFVSSDFASKFLILEKVPPAVDEVASMMNVKNCQEESSTQEPSLLTMPETAIPYTSTAHATNVPLTISMISLPSQLKIPSPAPTTILTKTLILALPDFSSLFGFDQRVSTLETELSQLKQVDHSIQLLEYVKSQLPTMVDDLLSTRIRYATRTALESYTKDFEKKS
nr:hypothetical protein [Tanacetum cinerariifolium]